MLGKPNYIKDILCLHYTFSLLKKFIDLIKLLEICLNFMRSLKNYRMELFF